MTKDMTRGNPLRLILAFALPLLLGDLFQQFYNIADTVVVGRTLGVDALSAVGATGGITFLIVGFAQGMTAGLSVLTAQRFGAGDMDGVRRTFAVNLLISAAVTAVLTAVSLLCVRPMLEWMRTPADIIDRTHAYLSVIYGGIFASILYNLLANTLRALGDSRTSLVFLIVASAFNIALDFVFILLFQLDVRGAAIATVASQLLSGICCALYIRRRFPVLHLRREDFRASWRTLRGHLRMGLPMGFQSSLIAIGSIVVQIALNSLGKTAIAAFTAASKVNALTSPVGSFGIATATYVAQNYGAGNLPRIREGVRRGALLNLIVVALATGIILPFGQSIVRLLVGNEPQVIALAHIYLLCACAGYPFLALLFIYRYALQGLGRSFMPTFAGMMELVMRLVMTLALAGPLGFTGVCLANPMAWVGSAVPLVIAYWITMRRMLRAGAEGLPAAGTDS